MNIEQFVEALGVKESLVREAATLAALGWTPFHFAILESKLDIIKYFFLMYRYILTVENVM